MWGIMHCDWKLFCTRAGVWANTIKQTIMSPSTSYKTRKRSLTITTSLSLKITIPILIYLVILFCVHLSGSFFLVIYMTRVYYFSEIGSNEINPFRSKHAANMHIRLDTSQLTNGHAWILTWIPKLGIGTFQSFKLALEVSMFISMVVSIRSCG